MFNMGGVATAKVVSNNFLKAGIHHVIFKGIDKAENFNALELRFEAVDGSGVHNERLFEPRSNERTESQYGTNPAESEQFMCKVKQIIDALDPELSEKIEKDGSKFAAPDFDGFCKLLKKYLDKKVGVETFIKLIPTTGNFVGFPGFVARLSKDGAIYMNNKVIGENLVLTPKEATMIENAATAKPTDMRKAANNDELSDLEDDFDVPANNNDDDDTLPF